MDFSNLFEVLEALSLPKYKTIFCIGFTWLPSSENALRLQGHSGLENLSTVRQHLSDCNDKLNCIRDEILNMGHQSRGITGGLKRDICADLRSYDRLLRGVQDTMERCPWLTHLLREVFRSHQFAEMIGKLIEAVEVLDSCWKKLSRYKYVQSCSI